MSNCFDFVTALFDGIVFLDSSSLQKINNMKAIIADCLGSCDLDNSALVNLLIFSFDLEHFASTFPGAMITEDSE